MAELAGQVVELAPGIRVDRASEIEVLSWGQGDQRAVLYVADLVSALQGCEVYLETNGGLQLVQETDLDEVAAALRTTRREVVLGVSAAYPRIGWSVPEAANGR